MKLKITSTFLKEILIAWSKINYDKDPQHIKTQILWNNSHIKNNNDTMVFPHWINKNIIYVKDIYNMDTKTFKTLKDLNTEYQISNTEFLNYYKLIASIPKEWIRKLESVGDFDTPTDKINAYEILDKTNTSYINKKLTEIQKMKNLQDKTKSQIKWELIFPQKQFSWKDIYTKAFEICKDNILQNFQYNFLHRNIATNKFLFKCNLIESSLCDFCSMEIESIDHLFWNCTRSQCFWNELFKWMEDIDIDINQDKFDVYFHTNNKTVSYILLFAKYFIYTCKQNKLLPNIMIFKQKVIARIKLEKYTAFRNDEIEKFNKDWSNFIQYI